MALCILYKGDKMDKMNAFLNLIGALNDETRVIILAFLQNHGELCVCDLQNALDLKQSRLSRHLKILKDCGFLYVKRKGTWAYYGINENLSIFHIECLKAMQELQLSLPPLQKITCNKEI